MARLVTEYLDRAAKAWPEKIAFAEGDVSISYGALKDRVQRVAQALSNRGCLRLPVAIYLDKSIACIEAMLGVAMSGSFYTVLDTDMPAPRIRRIMETLQPAVVITTRELIQRAGTFADETPVLCLEEMEQTLADEAALRVLKGQILDTDVLYVLFTSGSTGTPKGVVTPHRSVTNYIDVTAPLFGIGEDSVLLSQVPFYFVMSIIDIYGTMSAGATLHLVPKMYYSFPAMVMQYIARHQITTLYWVPSALCMIANLDAFDVADISCVKDVVFGGEVMPIRQLNKWRKALPEARFINSYGPTEITDCCSYYVVDRAFAETARLPIGIPLPNARLLVLDEHDRLLEGEGTGELCVRSTSINYGYYRDPERTAQVFVQNPLQSCYEEKIYRTGDLVTFNAFGELEYVGRKDFQIKHMGQRIELGEIEANVSSLPQILENCCLYDEAKQRIVLFYSGAIGEEELGRSLAELLPAYMLPGKRVQMDGLPHNLNGKIDRARLRERMG